MKYILSEKSKTEISEFFRCPQYASKSALTHETGKQIEQMLKDCGFVFISDNGSVVHAERFCGAGYNSPVHIS